MTGDSRQEDLELLEKHGLTNGKFGEVWEGELHDIQNSNYNQERWHLSRMSMLAGYLIGKGWKIDEVLTTLKNHRGDTGENQ